MCIAEKIEEVRCQCHEDKMAREISLTVWWVSCFKDQNFFWKHESCEGGHNVNLLKAKYIFEHALVFAMWCIGVISTGLPLEQEQKAERSDKKSEKNIRRYATLPSFCLIQSDVLWRRHWQNGAVHDQMARMHLRIGFKRWLLWWKCGAHTRKMTVRGTMLRSEVCNSWCFCLES